MGSLNRSAFELATSVVLELLRHAFARELLFRFMLTLGYCIELLGKFLPEVTLTESQRRNVFTCRERAH